MDALPLDPTPLPATRRPRRSRRATSGWRWRLATLLRRWADLLNPLEER